MSYQSVLEQLSQEYALSLNGIHGPRHWLRVLAFGEWLAERSGADLDVVRWFAIFHDCQRVSDGDDPQHGPRGGQRARDLLTDELSPTQLELLVKACQGHTEGTVSTDPTIGSCWDSDRCDLSRVHIVPHASLMSTEGGRWMAEQSERVRLATVQLQPFRSR